MTALISNELKAHNVKNKLEISSLDKEFSCTCVLGKNKAPHLVRAKLSFEWDSHLTATSVYGSDCSFYHDDSIECMHDEVEANASIEFGIAYNIAIAKGYENESQKIYSELMKVFKGIMEHENFPNITWEVTVNNEGMTFVSSINATQYWEIDVANTQIISFDGILEEVYHILQGIEELPFIEKGE
ncbi:hypothetical protein [Aquibacillus koreensis]|nr:hypothetical protein [Aquibacillus koreensis]